MVAVDNGGSLCRLAVRIASAVSECECVRQ